MTENLQTGETHVVSTQQTPTLLPAGAGNCHSPADSNGIAELDISRNGSRILLAQKVSTDADGNDYCHPT